MQSPGQERDRRRGSAAARVYSISGHGAVLPLRLNPFVPVDGAPLGRHIDLLKSVFNAAFPMFAGMPAVLEEAMLDIYTG